MRVTAKNKPNNEETNKAVQATRRSRVPDLGRSAEKSTHTHTMNTKQLAKAFIIFVFFPITAHARLGETTDQSDKRYGERLFKHNNGDLSYGLYSFSGKKIRVLFLKGKSILEMIVIGPDTVYSRNQAAEIGADSMKFVRGLLAQAYGFNEGQLLDLAKIKQISREEAVSGIENKSTRVIYSIQSDESQSTVKITVTIVDIEAFKRGEDLGFANFMGESVTLELKQAEVEGAEGF
jgi:hypothetical protein